MKPALTTPAKILSIRIAIQSSKLVYDENLEKAIRF